MFLEGTGSEVSGGPVIRSEVGIGLGDAGEGSLDEVTKSSGGTSRASVDVFDSGELKELLGSFGGDDASTTGGRDEAETNGTTFTGNLGGDGVGETELVTPVTSADGSDMHFGINDSTTDGGGNFFGTFDAQTDVTVFITNNNEGFEASALTGTGLFLDRGEFQNFILELITKEMVDDLILLDRDGEHKDFFQFGDFSGFD